MPLIECDAARDAKQLGLHTPIDRKGRVERRFWPPRLATPKQAFSSRLGVPCVEMPTYGRCAFTCHGDGHKTVKLLEAGACTPLPRRESASRRQEIAHGAMVMRCMGWDGSIWPARGSRSTSQSWRRLPTPRSVWFPQKRRLHGVFAPSAACRSLQLGDGVQVGIGEKAVYGSIVGEP